MYNKDMDTKYTRARTLKKRINGTRKNNLESNQKQTTKWAKICQAVSDWKVYCRFCLSSEKDCY